MNNHNKVIEKSILFYRGIYHYDKLQWTYQNAYEVHTTLQNAGYRMGLRIICIHDMAERLKSRRSCLLFVGAKSIVDIYQIDV